MEGERQGKEEERGKTQVQRGGTQRGGRGQQEEENIEGRNRRRRI